MRRVLMVVAAVTIPFSGVVLGLSGQAFAGVKITCTSIAGTETSSTISGCTGGDTGGSSPNFDFAGAAVGPVTIPWVSGNTTTLSKVTFAIAPKAPHCPGYVKSTKTAPYSGPEPSLVKFKGTVTADTGDGIKVPGKYSGEVCISTAGNLTAAKALKIS
jgi:hypothetical protein